MKNERTNEVNDSGLVGFGVSTASSLVNSPQNNSQTNLDKLIISNERNLDSSSKNKYEDSFGKIFISIFF